MRRLRRLLGVAAWAALLVAVLAWPVAWGLGATAERYQQIAPWEEVLVEVNRQGYAEEPSGKVQDVVAIYGTAVGEPTEYLFVSEDEVIRPEESPGLVLIRRPEAGQPVQLDLVYFLARVTSLGALAVALGLWGSLWLLGRRRRAQPGGQPAAP